MELIGPMELMGFAGFRFNPKPEELLHYYLHRRRNAEYVPPELVRDVDLYGQEDPWNMFDVGDGSIDCRFCIFTDLVKKSTEKACKKNNKRTAGSGYWLSKAIKDVRDRQGHLIGIDRYYTFETESEKKEKDNKRKTKRRRNHENQMWSMHEFSLVDGQGKSLDGKVVCVIQYSAPATDDESERSKKRRIMPHAQIDHMETSLKPNQTWSDINPSALALTNSQHKPCMSSAEAEHYDLEVLSSFLCTSEPHQVPVTAAVTFSDTDYSSSLIVSEPQQQQPCISNAPATKEDYYEWISSVLSGGPIQGFQDQLLSIHDHGNGHVHVQSNSNAKEACNDTQYQADPLSSSFLDGIFPDQL